MSNGASQKVKEAMADFATTVDDEWALVTAGTEESGWNTMTIGWGSAGTLWSKPTITVYVHPWRYTHDFLMREDYFTVQLFGGGYQRDLGILGAKSGRDGDKVALTSLTPVALEHGMTFAEATTTIVCKKIYTQAIDLAAVPDDVMERLGGRLYIDEAHTMFVGEIVGVK
ncbi:MAG: flavin reductase [Atopobiaceae bacterium]|nr:flavin reductase [Atopobiaceae bacterium]